MMRKGTRRFVTLLIVEISRAFIRLVHWYFCNTPVGWSVPGAWPHTDNIVVSGARSQCAVRENRRARMPACIKRGQSPTDQSSRVQPSHLLMLAQVAGVVEAAILQIGAC